MSGLTTHIIHNKEYIVEENLKGKYKDYCLCYKCDNFNKENVTENCYISQLLFTFNLRFNIRTPVFECHDFKQNERKD